MTIQQHLNGKRLRAMRERRGWTQEELADAISLTPQQVSRYERSERGNAYVTHVAAMAVYLDTTTDYLLGLTDDPTPRTMDVNLTNEETELIMAIRQHRHRDALQAFATLTK